MDETQRKSFKQDASNVRFVVVASNVRFVVVASNVRFVVVACCFFKRRANGRERSLHLMFVLLSLHVVASLRRFSCFSIEIVSVVAESREHSMRVAWSELEAEEGEPEKRKRESRRERQERPGEARSTKKRQREAE